MADNFNGKEKYQNELKWGRMPESWRVGAREDAGIESAGQPPLDQLDTAIARALEKDSRISLLELSRQLGTSRTTISERLNRLIEQGVIKGFHARLDYRRLGYPIIAFVGLQTSQSQKAVEVIEALKQIPEVEELHTVTGQIDMLVKLRARSTEHLQHILIFKIQSIPGIGRGETMLALSSHQEWAPIGIARQPETDMNGTEFVSDEEAAK
ncbi:MAG: Lrp/AsnC family transcriptional regulator [Chloroflexi bacterium]|uniref:Lrp/AsnC family transcriptional regulator n=1 Tax=Candidatus Chlorohelix allophototropha TaxID=3003348 RepID=A0A8T7M1L3_9CHLR|nr:Lrp/AsnC family transcriptional regulator [Chloroflexota bacterium]WJW66535.1 Lrp/AsnC family transcriptional regulator [Chloroflexota bacterium L227-S17]